MGREIEIIVKEGEILFQGLCLNAAIIAALACSRDVAPELFS